MQLIFIKTPKTLLIIIFNITTIANIHAQTCFEASRTCLDTVSPSTRTINGEAITKDCWSYDISYNCYDDTNLTYIDNCTDIRNISYCSQSSSDCQSHIDNDPVKNCISFKNIFNCSDTIDSYQSLNLTLESSTQSIATEYLDESNCTIYANNNNCTLKTPKSCLDTVSPSTQSINGLDIIRDCWNYSETYSCRFLIFIKGLLTDLGLLLGY